MTKNLILLIACVLLLISSCAPTTPYRRNDLRGYHYGKGHHYNGKYHGKKYRYNWEGNRIGPY